MPPQELPPPLVQVRPVTLRGASPRRPAAWRSARFGPRPPRAAPQPAGRGRRGLAAITVCTRVVQCAGIGIANRQWVLPGLQRTTKRPNRAWTAAAAVAAAAAAGGGGGGGGAAAAAAVAERAPTDFGLGAILVKPLISSSASRGSSSPDLSVSTPSNSCGQGRRVRHMSACFPCSRGRRRG